VKRGIVVGVAGAAIVVAGLAGCSSNKSNTSSTSSPSAATASSTPESASLQQLQQLAAGDRPFVSTQLADHWIPRLSSRHSTEPWTYDSEDGVEYHNEQTLQEHQRLRQQYGAKLLWSGDWTTFDAPDFWVTVVPQTFSDSGSALSWCTSQGLDADHCSAQIVSTTHPAAGSTAHN
jgi:hypothetical protein